MSEVLKKYIHPLKKPDDFDVIINRIGNASHVLMGEATHGTQEFYRARADLAKRLIVEKGFTTIAIEGDFPDAYRVNRYINGKDTIKSSLQALEDFKRFPAWMWRNEEMITFIDWLYNYNKNQPANKRVSFFGLDLYSLHTSISVVIETLKQIDPKAAKKAQERYQCFDLYENPQDYGYHVAVFAEKSCQEQVIAQLKEMKQKDVDFFNYDNLDPLEQKFYVEQNALVIKNAERYYRSLFQGNDISSWNIRDRHMMEMIVQIEKYNHASKRDNKVIVWAHNSHVGDARATQMASYGEVNIGQLVREHYGSRSQLIGFTTYTGTVSAASAWGADVERKFVRPALDKSIEALFNNLEMEAFILIPQEYPALYEFLNQAVLQRAIGVIYLPSSERKSHYLYATLSKQFDIVIHYDVTKAVTPLDITTEWEQGEDVPETFPFGV